MTAKILLGPIIGGLTHESVNLWARADGPGVLHAWIASGPRLGDARLLAKSAPLAAESGYCGVVRIERLKPETTYHYALTLDADRKPPRREFHPFRTAPPPGQTCNFKFMFGSCFRSQEGGGLIFERIRERHPDLAFGLLLGDQIYADEWNHNGLGRVAVSRADYRQVYAHGWANEHLRALLARLPVFMILDDHEVDNDWRWLDRSRRWAALPFYTRLWRWLRGRPPQERHLPLHRVRDALQAYWEHQGLHAPPMLAPLRREAGGEFELYEDDPGSLAYTFNWGPAAFFVMDTRTMRIRNPRLKIMLGEGQWQRLMDWLLAVKGVYPLKFLVTSSAFLFSMYFDVAKDRWSGYPRERDRLLYFLAEQGIEGVYLLTGDLHSGHAISARLHGPNGKRISLREFCASPFEQDTNWLARLFHRPLRSAALYDHQIHFVVARHNYGIVEVNLDDLGHPQVVFELHYEVKGNWEVERYVGAIT